MASDGHDGSDRASVTVWGLPAISRRTKLSEEGDCSLDRLFITGGCTYGLFIKVNCPVEVRGVMMPQCHGPVPYGMIMFTRSQTPSLSNNSPFRGQGGEIYIKSGGVTDRV